MAGGYVPEVRVTVNENLDSYLDKIVASGLYPSKAELMRCGMVHLLKDLNLIQNLINTNKKPEI
jgi:Arc/MetJ-type ribon-helix-helix transcriptional regulator